MNHGQPHHLQLYWELGGLKEVIFLCSLVLEHVPPYDIQFYIHNKALDTSYACWYPPFSSDTLVA